MIKLSNKEIDKILNDFPKMWQGSLLSVEDKNQIKETYLKIVMKCAAHKDFNDKLYHESVLTDIAIGQQRGEKQIDIVGHYYKGAYMSYFDNILGPDQTSIVEQALINANLDSSIFKGLKKGIDNSFAVNTDKGRVEVKQVVEKVNEQSPVVVAFEITLNGKEIYSFHISKEEMLDRLAFKKDVLRQTFSTKERIKAEEYTVVTKKKKNGKGYYTMYFKKGHRGRVKNPHIR